MISSLNLYTTAFFRGTKAPFPSFSLFPFHAHLQSGLHAEPIVLRIGSQGLLLPQFVPGTAEIPGIPGHFLRFSKEMVEISLHLLEQVILRWF